MAEFGLLDAGVFLSGWALTYLLHSAVILGAAWLLERAGVVRRPSARDLMWKTALIAGVVTASVQVAVPFVRVQEGGTHAVRRVAAVPGHVSRRLSAELPKAAIGLPAELPAAARATFGFPAELPAAGQSIRVEAQLRDPSQECLDFLRNVLNTGGPKGGAIANACASAPWVPVLPWVLMGVWILGSTIAGMRYWARARALGDLLAHREVVTSGYARTALDQLIALNPELNAVVLHRVEGLESPAALGPREIGLPFRAAEMPSDEIRVAMAHEVAHLVRKDPRWMRVSALLSSLLFFQPLNFLAGRRLRETAELSADDWAVECTGAPLTLARSLARVAEWVSPLTVAPVLAMAGASGTSLGDRVERILGKSDRRPVSRAQALSFVVMLLVATAWIPAIRVPAPSTVRVFEGSGEPLAVLPAGAEENVWVKVMIASP